MGRAVLSINANKSMNLVLMNILNKDFDFFCAEDEHCDDCLDFIHFIRSSKIHKRKVVVLSGKNDLPNLNTLRKDDSVQILIKPFNPGILISSYSKYIRKIVK